MDLYIELRNLEKKAVESGNIDAACYALETIPKIVNNKINSYKYTHSDLTKNEVKLLLKMNDLSEDGFLIGGEFYQVRNNTWTKTKEIDLFLILEQIQQIVKNRKNGLH